MNKNILIIAGEASGDLHGASLINEMKKNNSSLLFYGIGGDKMVAEGLNPLYHINKMAFLGFVEVIKHLPFIRKVRKDVIELVKAKNIKNVILIDYPGFNLNLAEKLKNNGIKIFYYISPQLWAWGSGRIEKIKKFIDKMIVLFPFEEKLYRENGIDVAFVGHPLIHQIDEYKFDTKEDLFNKHGLDLSKEILLLLPGSRKQEIEKIFPAIIGGALKVASEFNLQVVVGCADSINKSEFKSYSDASGYKVIKNITYDLIKYSKLGIIKSGTSTLEAALLGLPMMIVYKTNSLTYLIGKSLVKLKHIGLANIVAGKSVVPELIQERVNEVEILKIARSFLTDTELYNYTKKELAGIRKLLSENHASEVAAKVICGSLL
ncbi:MAG: lipid-A-disaccharide synthase [Ignavibacteriaceae bacterium]|nr:lipid-A-disaccharide synthase [Ignavibacteriaceae bacterium]